MNQAKVQGLFSVEELDFLEDYLLDMKRSVWPNETFLTET
jgi:hypothetical protein